MTEIPVATRQVPVEMVEVAGAPTALRRSGSGDPLLFLHGAGFTGSWLRFHESLAQGAEVIAPEHIGFGDTPMQDWLRSIDDMVLHYDDLVRTLDLARVDLVGYSLGGWIAAKYAALWPERVRSLTLLVPAGLRLPGTPTPPDLFLMTEDQLGEHLFHDRSNMAEAMSPPEGVDPVDAAMAMYEQMAAFARMAWNPRHDRALPRMLRRVNAPVLLVGAEDDQLAPDANTVQSYAQLIPDSRVKHIPGTGHALVIEQPDLVARTILEFTAEISSGGQS